MNRKDVISVIAALGLAVAINSAHSAEKPSSDAVAVRAGDSAVMEAHGHTAVLQEKVFVEKLALRSIGVDIT